MTTKILSALALIGLLAAAALAQAASWRTVLPEGWTGRAAFVDGDGYARMTRAREVFGHPGHVVQAHDFENFPAGVPRPHTTAPLDDTVAALAALLRCLRPADGAELALDRAGAMVSPLFGVATLTFLFFWTGREQRPWRWPALTLAALSPILAHGFALGRPDHQSLQLFLVAVALAVEDVLWRRSSRPWALAGGLAWGLALWVSLYEPVVLLAGVLTVEVVFHRATLRQRERLWELATGAGVLGLALLVEGGWRPELPGQGSGVEAGLFAAWTRQVGELGSLPPWSDLILRWVGVGTFAAPVLLGWAAWRGGERGAACWLGLLLGTWALTCWQVRWGYFLALVAAMSLPAQAHALAGRPRWVFLLAVAAWLVGLGPVLGEFAGRAAHALHPHTADYDQATEAVALMQVADFIRRDAVETDPPAPPVGSGGILAPWWLSPALAYRSGQPAVAGSSHESLPGTADAARFFLFSARDPAATALLRARRVRWVVTDDPDRVLTTGADLLGNHSPPADALGAMLARFPLRAPRGLRLAYANPFFKVYAVESVVYAPSP